MTPVRRVGHLLPAADDPGGVAALVAGLHEAAPELQVESSILKAVRGGASSPWPFGPPPAAVRDALDEQVAGLDALLVHGVFSPDVARVQAWAQRSRPDLAVVRFPHDAYDVGLFEQRRRLKQAYFAAVERPGLRRSDLIVTTAPSHELWLRRLDVEARVVCHPAGLAPAEHESAAAVRERRKPPSPDGVVRMLHLGRWDMAEKGLDLSVAACQGRPPGTLALRLVGPDAGQAREVHALARHAPAVEAVGFVTDVWEELAATDVLLAPSRKEGFGLAALQALCAGVPILLSSRAGLAEYLQREDGAVVVHPSTTSVRAGVDDILANLPALTRAAQQFGEKRGPLFTTRALLTAVLSELGGR